MLPRRAFPENVWSVTLLRGWQANVWTSLFGLAIHTPGLPSDEFNMLIPAEGRLFDSLIYEIAVSGRRHSAPARPIASLNLLDRGIERIADATRGNDVGGLGRVRLDLSPQA
jgi:hypothetical protein